MRKRISSTDSQTNICHLSLCALLSNVIQWFRRRVLCRPPPFEELPPPLTCVRGGGGLPYSSRFVTACALWAPSGTDGVWADVSSCAWVDCNALMDLYDIYEPDVRRHPSHALWRQDHIRGPLVWQQQHFFFVFNATSLRNLCRSGLNCPGWRFYVLVAKQQWDVCLMWLFLKIYMTLDWAAGARRIFHSVV